MQHKPFYSFERMLKRILWVALLFMTGHSYGQQFLNGSFENNTAGSMLLNLSNATFNSVMPNCTGFGTSGNLDIIDNTSFSGGAKKGNYFVAMTGGGTDMLSLELSSPLVVGQSYTISFFDKTASGFVAGLVEVGLSSVNNAFGTLVYTSPATATIGAWNERYFTFTATSAVSYVTIRQQGLASNWVHLDNFKFVCPFRANLGADTTLCAGGSLTLHANANALAACLWQDGSTDTVFQVSSSGLYWLQMINSCGAVIDTVRDSIVVTFDSVPKPNILGKDTLICPNRFMQLRALQPNCTYLWFDNTTQPFVLINAPGTYWVTVTNHCGTTTDSIKIGQDSLPVFSFGSDTLVCSGSLLLDPSCIATNYFWQDFSRDSTYLVQTSGLYWCRAFNRCGVHVDSINVQIDSIPSFSLGSDTSICAGQLISLSIDSFPGATYLWQNGDTTLTQQIVSGTYWFQMTSRCATIRDSLQVDLLLPPSLSFGNDTTICKGIALNLVANTDPFTTVLWQDNSTANAFQVTTSGIYWAGLTNSCGVASDTIQVALDSLPALPLLGNDTSICQGSQYLLNLNFLPNVAYQWQNGSSSASQVIQPGLFWLQASNQCGVVRDTLLASPLALPDADLGSDTSICSGETLVLDQSGRGTSYLWSNGSTATSVSYTQSATITVTVSNACGSDQDVMVLNVKSLPVVDLGPDTAVCPQEPLLLSAGSSSAQLLWMDEFNQADYTVTAAGTYWVELTEQGCTAYDTIVVSELACAIQLELPQAFSPNNDGINDFLQPISWDGIQGFELRIMNRWGKELFKSSTWTPGWDGKSDGKEQSSGTYFWILDYQNSLGQSESRSGTILLMR